MAYSKNTDAGLIVPKKWWGALPRPSWSRFTKVETAQPWFDVFEVTPECYALLESGQFEEVISYLVLGEDRAALIDTGNGIGDIRGLVEELTDLPVSVICTHSHTDHTGDCWRFDEVALYDNKFARDRLKGRSKEDMTRFLGDGMVWKPLPSAFSLTNYETKTFAVTQWMRERDVFDLGGKTLEVTHTPGHSPDSVSLLERREKLLFTGDIFYLAPIYVYAPSTSLDEFIGSFRKMVAIPYDYAMPGHNETMVERRYVEAVLAAAESIKAGAAGSFKAGVARGIKVHRYDFDRFSLIVRDE